MGSRPLCGRDRLEPLALELPGHSVPIGDSMPTRTLPSLIRKPCSYAVFAGLLLSTACSPGCTPPASPPADGNAPAAAAEGGAVAAGETIREAKGVDFSKLTDIQLSTFFDIINTEPSACGKPHSLAKSVRDDAACRDSRVVAQFVADNLAGGAPTADVKAGAAFVAESLQPREIKGLNGRPTFGADSAPVTVVVFADYECPHCAQEAPGLQAAIKAYRGKAKLVYRHFPLQSHARARYAAIAAEAAYAQGKFWEYSNLLFQNQSALEDDDLVAYAGRVGLDVAAFKAAYAAKTGEPLVDGDRSEGERLEIQGTPAVFVNGRYYNEALFGGTIEGWIDDALKR